MRLPLKDLMDNLGVGEILSAYETCPWSAYDDEKEVSCNAEVRMDSEGNELEAEMQIIRDNPTGDEQPVEQIFWLLAKPAINQKWDVKTARVKGEDQSGAAYGWEEKAVSFFHACVQDLKLDKIPDIDEIYEREINKKDGARGGGGGGGGSKSPKIKPQSLLGMKGGRGF